MHDTQDVGKRATNTTTRKRGLGRRALLLFVYVCIVSVFAAAAISELGGLWWVADLFSHLRFQYLGAALVATALALALRRPVLALAGVAAIIPHAVVIASVPFAQTAVAGAGDDRVRIATANIQWDGPYRKYLVAYAATTNADVITLQEITPETAPIIDALKRNYPYITPSNWSSLAYGIIILSRFPLEDAQIIRAPYSPMVVATVNHKAGRFRLIAVHAPNTITATIHAIAAEYHVAWAQEAARTSLPVIVAGDFNATPWSPRMRKLTADRNLAFVGQYWNWPRTWPAHAFPTWFLAPRLLGGVPIDHVLVSRHFAAVLVRRGPYIGSDHYPVAAELRFRP